MAKQQFSSYCACTRSISEMVTLHRSDCPDHPSNKEQTIRADEREAVLRDVREKVARLGIRPLSATKQAAAGWVACREAAFAVLDALLASSPAAPSAPVGGAEAMTDKRGYEIVRRKDGKAIKVLHHKESLAKSGETVTGDYSYLLPLAELAESEECERWLTALMAEHREWARGKAQMALDNVAERMGLGEQFAALLDDAGSGEEGG